MKVPAFFSSRLLISRSISAAFTSENVKKELTDTFLFISKILGWFSNFLTALSTGSSIFELSVSKSLFSVIANEETVAIKYLLNFSVWVP